MRIQPLYSSIFLLLALSCKSSGDKSGLSADNPGITDGKKGDQSHFYYLRCDSRGWDLNSKSQFVPHEKHSNARVAKIEVDEKMAKQGDRCVVTETQSKDSWANGLQHYSPSNPESLFIDNRFLEETSTDQAFVVKYPVKGTYNATLILNGRALLLAMRIEMPEPPTSPSNNPFVGTPVDPTDPVVALHDLSVLFNGVEGGKAGSGLLSSNDLGVGGKLVPNNANTTNRNLVATGFRLDPCFPMISLMESAPASCVPQIRIIFQSPFPKAFDDFALHALYDLKNEDFKSLIKEMAALGDHSPEALKAPLGVHPKIAKEGNNGPTATAMKKIILRYAGTANLKRFSTVQFVGGRSDDWAFRSSDLVNGKPQESHILNPSISHISIDLTTGGSQGRFLNFDKFAPGLDYFLKLNNFSKEDLSEESRKKAITSLAAYENPFLATNLNTPCLGCHFVQPLRDFHSPLHIKEDSIKSDPRYNVDLENLVRAEPIAFASPSQVFNPITAKVTTRNFRMFGYFGDTVRVSQRVVNETAAVKDALLKFGYYK